MPSAADKAEKSQVKVAVRVRPLNRREIDMSTPVCIEMAGDQTHIYPSAAHLQRGDNDGRPSSLAKTFAFDHCFWSVDSSDQKFASQETVFRCLGLGVMDNAFHGYNACILAYGQTGSGKSYTMMGSHDQKGIIPKLCDALFERISYSDHPDTSHKVEVSYMEIYNEKVHDLLDGQGQRKNLRVREHAILGPYVDGLSQLVVSSFEEIEKLMSEGNKSRTVAATNMNSESSRSHAVFNIILTQTLTDRVSDVSGEKVSKVSLVDLAGSERAQKTGAVGERLREGCNINKSLTTLMLVISALADSGGGKGKAKFVPYRDSVLTWLLKDNLGGNSKTVMVATLSPAADNYEETLSTLRYADRAKRIVNHAVVNEDPNAKIIRELREEVELLRRELETAKEMQAPELKEKLEESEKLMRNLNKTWEEKLEETERIHKERHEALEKMGISVDTSGIKVEMSKFHLVNLNADPSLNELLVYYLKDYSRVGSAESEDIQLHGLGIMQQHCGLQIVNNEVYILPIDNARTLVNGRAITDKTPLSSGDRILWGMNHFFRLNCPKQIDNSLSGSNDSTLTTSSSTGGLADYDYAQQEVMLAELSGDPIRQAMTDLEKHHVNEREAALNRQRLEYESKLEALKSQLAMSPGQGLGLSASMMHLPPPAGGLGTPGTTPGCMWPSMASIPGMTGSQILPSPSNSLAIQNRYQEWLQEREQLMLQSLNRLREQVAKANALVREANFLADEMSKATEYSVTLQIPSANLSPNGKRGGIISEPAILVKRGNKPHQIWSMDKFENKIIDMREFYEERKDSGLPLNETVDDVIYLDPLHAIGLESTASSPRADPFFDAQENHSLIGVANIYLRCLFNHIKFKYNVPIINQQGEISGKLAVELCLIKGDLPDPAPRDSNTGTAPPLVNPGPVPPGCTMISSMSNASLGACPTLPPSGLMTQSAIVTANMDQSVTSPSGPDESEPAENSKEGGPSRSASGYSLGATVTVRVRIVSASQLPAHLSHFVFSQYQFWGEADLKVVPPALQPNYLQRHGDTFTVKFAHQAEFTVPVTDDFLEHCNEDALSIEVYGNRAGSEGERISNGSPTNSPSGQRGRTSGPTSPQTTADDPRRFGYRWVELYRRLEFWIAIEELNDQGQYQKVEVSCAEDMPTGGIYQLRHGQSRRVRVFVRPNKVSRGGRGMLPLVTDSIQQISIDCISSRHRGTDKHLDSYQEEDLNILRDCWSDAVRKRQDYLHEQLQKVVNKAGKTAADESREQSLMSQWLRMTAERDAVLVPAPGSGIPGAPANWTPPPGMEHHCPLIFLNINTEDMTAGVASALGEPVALTTAGVSCVLSEEEPSMCDYVSMPIVKRYETLCGAVGQWDASLHDSIHMNRVTQHGERVYLVVKVVVRLSHPSCIDLVLRKRICVNIFKKQGFTNYLKKQWTRYVTEDANNICWTGVTYQIVSSIPQASLDIEDRESLAQMAASQGERSVSSADGESYIEKYMRSVSAVESLLQLDKLRQEVALKEMLAMMKKRRAAQNAASGRYSGGEPGTPLMSAFGAGLGGIRKYISVPDLQGMSRSFSLNSLSATNALSPGEEGVKAESVIDLTKKISDGDEKRDKRPALLRRPEPPKALLTSAKNPLISPLAGQPGNAILGRLSRPSMGTLEEERIRQEIIPRLERKEAENRNRNGSPNKPDMSAAVSPDTPSSERFQEDVPASADTPGDTLKSLEGRDSANTAAIEERREAQLSGHSTTQVTYMSSVDNSQGFSSTTLKSEDSAPSAEAITLNTEESSIDLSAEAITLKTEESSSAPSVEAITLNTEKPSSAPSAEEITLSTEESSSAPSAEAITLNTEESSSAPSAEAMTGSDKMEEVPSQEGSVSSPAIEPEAQEAMEAEGTATDELGEDWRSQLGASCYDLDQIGTGEGATESRDVDTPAECVPGWLSEGVSVLVASSSAPGGKIRGWVQFVGETKFAHGTWVGVELEQPEGKNDGSIKGVRYFTCQKQHGIFVRPDKLSLEKKRRAGKKSDKAASKASRQTSEKHGR